MKKLIAAALGGTIALWATAALAYCKYVYVYKWVCYPNGYCEYAWVYVWKCF